MPVLTYSYKDFCNLLGKKVKEQELVDLLMYAKAELDGLTGDELGVDYNDTNQPHLWSVEGLTRLLRGVMGKEKGIPASPADKPTTTVQVERKVLKQRPHIACFIARGKKVDDTLLKQLIQLQEKLADTFGRKRRKISIGLYPLQAIKFPVSVRALPKDARFTPLDFHESATLKKIVETHPKGKLYGHILEGHSEYPCFVDADKNIMSLIPVINSEQTGRVAVGDDAFFFDTTGTDEEAVNLVANIFAQALLDRGFNIEKVTIQYPTRKQITPTFATKKARIKRADVESLLGVTLSEMDLKKHFQRMRYDYANGTVTIPPYRHDIMHQVDLIEDVGISIGYNSLEPLPLKTHTPGGALPKMRAIDVHRDLWVGLGYQELFSAMLSNKELLYDKMNVADAGTVEISNFVSQTYSCVRTWLLPILLDCLSRNKHVDYPQKIFEQGLVTRRDDEQVWDEEHIAGVSTHTSASFTEMKQAVDFVMRMQNVEYTMEEFELDCFIPGRAARVIVKGKEIGFLGEIHPAVLRNFGLETPVAGCELSLMHLRQE